MAAYVWTKFTAFKDGSEPILKEERDELWSALGDLLNRCGGRWKLTEAKMALVRDNGWITDLTYLEDVEDSDETVDGDLAKVLIDIEDTFTGTTGYDAFKAVASDEGLDDAKLAEFITDSGRIQGSEDDYKLWNLYKRVIDYLQCCPTSPPEVISRRRGASKSKWGYSHNGVNFYWEMTGSGSDSVTFPGDPADTVSSSMSATGDVDISTQTRRITLSRSHSSSVEGSGSTTWPTCDWHNFWYGFSGSTNSFLTSFAILAGYEPGVCEPTNSGSFYLSGLPSSHGVSYPSPSKIVYPGYGAGDYEVDFEDEYTDEDLESDVMDALGDFVIGGGAGSYRNKAADGTSLSIDEEKHSFNLAGFGPLKSGETYRIPYLIRFTPAGGGAAVDGAETYLEFVFTTGMTETTAIDLPIPGESGTTSLVVVGFLCGPFDAEEDGE